MRKRFRVTLAFIVTNNEDGQPEVVAPLRIRLKGGSYTVPTIFASGSFLGLISLITGRLRKAIRAVAIHSGEKEEAYIYQPGCDEPELDGVEDPIR